MFLENRPLTKIGEFEKKIQTEQFKGTEKITGGFEIENHGEFNRISLRNDVLCCIDPRDSAPLTMERKDNHPGKRMYDHPNDGIKFPGGTIGLAMALAGAGMSAEKAVETVIKYEESKGRIVAFHTDTHKDTCGCGHVGRATDPKNQELYGLSSDTVVGIVGAFNDKIRNGLTVRKAILMGHHEEEAVLIIKSDKEINETVKSKDPDKRFFIYDQTASDNILEDLAVFARKEEGWGVTKKEVLDAAHRQVNATVGLLAANLPMFEIDLTDKANTVVTPIGAVPALACAA